MFLYIMRRTQLYLDDDSWNALCRVPCRIAAALVCPSYQMRAQSTRSPKVSAIFRTFSCVSRASKYYRDKERGRVYNPLWDLPRDFKKMTFTRAKHILTTAIASALLLGGLALAQRPKENVSAGRHPNLAAAQRLSQQAWQRIVDAQQANEWDMQGHAQKAKNLLDEVNRELKLAAEAANRK